MDLKISSHPKHLSSGCDVVTRRTDRIRLFFFMINPPRTLSMYEKTKIYQAGNDYLSGRVREYPDRISGQPRCSWLATRPSVDWEGIETLRNSGREARDP